MAVLWHRRISGSLRLASHRRFNGGGTNRRRRYGDPGEETGQRPRYRSTPDRRRSFTQTLHRKEGPPLFKGREPSVSRSDPSPEIDLPDHTPRFRPPLALTKHRLNPLKSSSP